MKILIIEDKQRIAYNLATALEGLGEIRIFTDSEMFAGGEFSMRMDAKIPPINEVREMIQHFDLMLLDQWISREYLGEDLLPACEGKRIIGISDNYPLGQQMFAFKNDVQIAKHRRDLRALVENPALYLRQ